MRIIPAEVPGDIISTLGAKLTKTEMESSIYHLGLCFLVSVGIFNDRKHTLRIEQVKRQPFPNIVFCTLQQAATVLLVQ